MANKKISDYTEALSAAADDFFEISVDLGGGSYATRKIKKSNLGLGGSPLTTKGDLYTFDSADARLAIGSDGEVLIADSAEATGMRWGTVSSNSIYTADDSLTGNRVLTLATYSLEVQNSTASTVLKLEDSGAFMLGVNASSNSSRNVAIGQSATATTGTYGIAIGYNSVAGGIGTAIGLNTDAGTSAVAIGENSQALGTKGTALGYYSEATGDNVAIGGLAKATGIWSTALGFSTSASAQESLAIGSRVFATANSSYIIGVCGTNRPNSTANSFEVNFDEVTPTFKFGQTADGWLNSTGGFLFGATTVDASAALQVDSTTKGFLPPRMTTTEKNAITTPATGLVVFDTTLAKLCVYTGAAWETVTSA